METTLLSVLGADFTIIKTEFPAFEIYFFCMKFVFHVKETDFNFFSTSLWLQNFDFAKNFNIYVLLNLKKYLNCNNDITNDTIFQISKYCMLIFVNCILLVFLRM